MSNLRDINNLNELNKQKEIFLRTKDYYGVFFCLCLIMKHKHLDVIFDQEKQEVQEYLTVLKKIIATENINHLLYITVEIEKCTGFLDDMDCKMNVHPYFDEEIKKHYDSCFEKKDYRFEIMLHLVMVKYFIFYEEPDGAKYYLGALQDLLQKRHGEESAVYRDLEWRLFNITHQELEGQKASMLMSICYGEEDYDNAARYFDVAINNISVEENIALTQQIVYLITMQASIFCMKNNFDKMLKIINKGMQYSCKLDKDDILRAEMQLVRSLYYYKTGDFKEAMRSIESAIELSERVKNDEKIVKYKANKALYYYEYGFLKESLAIVETLIEIIEKKPEQYNEGAFIILQLYKFEGMLNGIDPISVIRFERILSMIESKAKIYELMVLKSNLLSAKLIQVINKKKLSEDIKNLYDELDEYYSDSNMEGYYLFLSSKVQILLHENRNIEALACAKQVYCYYENHYKGVPYRPRLESFFFYLKLLLRNNKYKDVAALLDNMYQKYIEPVFHMAETLCVDVEELVDYLNPVYEYVGAYISIAEQFPQINITEDMIYNMVLNCKNAYSRIWGTVKHYRSVDLIYLERELAFKESKIGSANQLENQLKEIERKKYQEELKRTIKIESKYGAHISEKSLTQIPLNEKQLFIEFFSYLSLDFLNDGNLINTLLNPGKHMRYMIFTIQSVIHLNANRVVATLKIPLNEIANYIETEDLKHIYQMVFQPLEKYMQGKSEIILGIDPLISLIPFHCLIDSRGRYLVETYRFINVESGRDIRREKKIADDSMALIVGNPTYNISTVYNEENDNLQQLAFSEKEAKAIAGILKTDSCLVGIEATKANVCKGNSQILHIASHSGVVPRDPDSQFVHYTLAGTYVALAGYNDYKNTGKIDDVYENGFLTGSEISMMDLENIELVMLSSCDSGVPTLENIETAQGLRWAFKLAGAKASITSMWEVGDREAAFFAITFYHMLKTHGIVSKAMQQAQIFMQRVTKQEVISNPLYFSLDLNQYLKEFNDRDKPFNGIEDWGAFMYQMN